MEKSLAAALDYVPRWLDFQMRDWERPGLVVAVAERGRVVFERAWGHADLKRRIDLTPRHRFRVASHSKSFTAAGIMKLRERRKLHLDDPVGLHVHGLHRGVAAVTLQQLLSHSGGVVRDGRDSGQWQDRRPFLDADEIRADLADGTIIDPNTRFKYSNHGYGLLGMAIEAITGESYNRWIKREIVEAAGLEETEPDVPLKRGTPFLTYTNEAVLPFYIMHQTVLLVVGYLVLPWHIPDPAKWLVTAVISFAAVMAMYEFAVRRNNVLRVLFGMKVVPRRPPVGVLKPADG